MKSPVVVIGGGAAGLLAAGRAAQIGARVILLEKMGNPGRKLAITGKGRCNLTNIATVREFIGHFGPDGKFLYQSFSVFFSEELLNLLHQLGIETKTERGGRVFPVSDSARDIVDALVLWNRKNGVDIRCKQPVTRLILDERTIRGVEIKTGQKTEKIETGTVILATGGASYPGTGSTGDGYRWAESAGHTIIPIRPALVPLETDGPVAQHLQGLSLRNVRVAVFIDGKKETDGFGEMLFTHYGVSGPIILTQSDLIARALMHKQSVEISIDLKPALDAHQLDTRLRRDLNTYGKRHFQNLLKELMPQSLIPVCLDATGIPENKPAHQINRQERVTLRKWLKNFRLKIIKSRPISEAIVTAGGIHLKEVNPKTLESLIIHGLFFAGEILNIHADTGGYNLQAAFSTGWAAGSQALSEKDSDY